MRKSLVALAVVFLPFSAFAQDYKCEFLENETGATGLAELKETADGKYKLRLRVESDGQVEDGTSDNAVAAEAGDDDFAINLMYTYYDIAHGNQPPVARAEVKSAKGAQFSENDGEMEVNYVIFRDAEENTLDQYVQLNGYPIACKR